MVQDWCEGLSNGDDDGDDATNEYDNAEFARVCRASGSSAHRFRTARAG
jgi:hypothetical protein